MKRPGPLPNARALPLALAVAALSGLALAGCAVTSPTTITTPYPASDGSSAQIPDTQVSLRNFLVVSPAAQQAGQMIGAIANGGDRPAEVQLSVAGTAQPVQVLVSVPPGGLVQVGPGRNRSHVLLAQVPEPPGSVIQLSAEVNTGGKISFDAPVLPPTGYYANYTVPPSPTATPSGTPGAGSSPGSSGSSSGSPTGSPSASVTS